MNASVRSRIAKRLLVFHVSALLGLSVAASGAEPDSVTGSMTAGGKTYRLAHVYARRQPSMADKSRTVIVVLLTDNEVPKSIVEEKFRLELTDLARQGKIYGVSVTLDTNKKPSDTGFTYAKELDGAIVNRADQHTFEPVLFNDSRIEGKLSGRGSFGDAKWDYTATFKAALAAMK
jgi:hypothetical protein